MSGLGRWSASVAGAAMVAFGAYELVGTSSWPALRSVGVWFAGGVLGHDLLLAPLVVVIGVALVRLVPGTARSYLQGALLVSGMVALATLPLVLGMGRDPRVPSQQPLPYGRDLLLVGLAVWVVAGLLAVVRLMRERQASGLAAIGAAVKGRVGRSSVEQGPEALGDLVPGPRPLDPRPTGEPHRRG